MGLFAVSLLVGGLTAGCAEDEESFQVRAPVKQELHCAELPHTTPDDSFWLAQAIAEANRPPATPFRSTVSLGYVGDEPLSNGVMHDTPLPARAYPDPLAQLAAPFKSDRSSRSYYYGQPYGGFRWR